MHLYTMLHTATSVIMHSVDRCTTRQDATNHSPVQFPTLSESKLPQSLWAESLSTATHLRNRSPTKAVKGKTLYKTYHGIRKKLDVGHYYLCIFGYTMPHMLMLWRTNARNWVCALEAMVILMRSKVKGCMIFLKESVLQLWCAWDSTRVSLDKKKGVKLKPAEPVVETQ